MSQFVGQNVDGSYTQKPYKTNFGNLNEILGNVTSTKVLCNDGSIKNQQSSPNAEYGDACANNGGRSANQPIDFVKYEQDQLNLERAKLNAVMLEKNPNYNSLTDKVFGKQEGWSFTRAFRLGGYTILGVILGRYVAKNMGKSTNLGMVIGGILPYVAYKLSIEYDKKQFSKQPQQAPKQPVDMSNLTNINKGGNAMPLADTDLQILSKIPSQFIIKSNGYNTTYYKDTKDKNLTGFSAMFSVPDVYKQSGRTDGSIGTSSPIKITIREFSDAYNEYLKQPK
jgi:hypothetical protein